MPPASDDGVVVSRPPAARAAPAAGARVVRVLRGRDGVGVMMVMAMRACLDGAAGLDLGRGLDGAGFGVGTAEARHECWAGGSGLDELVAAAEETHD